MKPNSQGTYLSWPGYFASRQIDSNPWILSSCTPYGDGTINMRYIGTYETTEQLQTAVKVRTEGGIDR